MMNFTFRIYLALITLMMAFNSNATDYYVSKNGNDSNTGKSVEQAWLTIARANSAVVAGDAVFLMEGTYQETIRPAQSGTDGNYITYTNYQNDVVIITDVYYGADISFRNYIKIDGLTIDGQHVGDDANVYTWVFMDGGSYNVVENCLLLRARGWCGLKIRQGAHHNKILNNVMYYCGSYPRDNGDMISIQTGYSNLIEGNTCAYGGHNIISVDGFNNVVRNNDFTNPWERIAESSKAGEIEARNLFENNRFYGASPATDNAIPPALKLVGDYQIVRKNHIYNNTAYGFQLSPNSNNGYPKASHLRIYNNVFYNNGAEAIKLWRNVGDEVVDDNILKNNIFYKNGSAQEVNFIFGGDGFYNNKVVSNNFFRTIAGMDIINFAISGNQNVAWYEANYPGYFSGNMEIDPGFIDAEQGDFRLSSGSGMIDAGSYLAKITSADGTGTSFTVDDASYFMDGWTIIKGDIIQLEGQALHLEIVGIDYATNTITVKESLTWTQGQGISLAYIGHAPDMGPLEYGSTAAWTLSVVSGAGGNYYDEGEVVKITASLEQGKEFSQWTGDVAYVEDVTSPSTTFTMPARNAAVTASYTNLSYALTVTNGSGSGEYLYEETVEIVADTPPEGLVFVKWIGDVKLLADIRNPATTVSMPAANVSVTATYAEPPSSSETKYEAEDLPTTVSEGDAERDVDNSKCSAEKFNLFDGNAVDDYVEYTISVAEAGNYNVKVQNLDGKARAIFQLQIDGTNQGAPVDGYFDGGQVTETDLGDVNLTGGSHLFRFVLTGKNEASTGFKLGIDYIKLTRLDQSTGMVARDAPELSVFPNPANSELIVNSVLGWDRPVGIRLFTLRGKNIYQSNGTVIFPHQIDVSSFCPGIYIIQVFNENETFTGKIVKK